MKVDIEAQKKQAQPSPASSPATDTHDDKSSVLEQQIRKKIAETSQRVSESPTKHVIPSEQPTYYATHPPAVPPSGDIQSCWLKTRFRDIGQMVSECSPGLEKSEDLCYPICKDGFQGVSDNCWSKCPKGFRSNGSFCQKPKSLGRGWGSHSPCANCEKWGLLWYPKCPQGYHTVGCCLCSPDCPPGLKDDGQQCSKTSYSR